MSILGYTDTLKGHLQRDIGRFTTFIFNFSVTLVFEEGALGYTRNRKTEEKFIQNRKTANKIGQNRKPHTKLYTQIGPNRKKNRKNQKPHWVPKPKNR